RRRFSRTGRAMGGLGRRRCGAVLRRATRHQLLPGSGNRESVIVQQFSDPKKQLNVLGPVGSLAGLVLGRGQTGELRLPVAQNMSFNADDLADFANPVVKLLRFELHANLRPISSISKA